MLIPNPFYQAYAAAAAASGAEPIFLPSTRESGFLPELEAIADQRFSPAGGRRDAVEEEQIGPRGAVGHLAVKADQLKAEIDAQTRQRTEREKWLVSEIASQRATEQEQLKRVEEIEARLLAQLEERHRAETETKRQAEKEQQLKAEIAVYEAH